MQNPFKDARKRSYLIFSLELQLGHKIRWKFLMQCVSLWHKMYEHSILSLLLAIKTFKNSDASVLSVSFLLLQFEPLLISRSSVQLVVKKDNFWGKIPFTGVGVILRTRGSL